MTVHSTSTPAAADGAARPGQSLPVSAQLLAWTLDGTLDAQLAQLQRPAHVAVIYPDFATVIPVVSAFLSQGFAARDHCVYILGEQSELAVCGLLAAHVDVRGERARRAFEFLSLWEPHRPPGQFDPDAIVAMTRHRAEQSVAAGFSGLRVVADMTWVLRVGGGHEQLLRFDAIWNDLPVIAPVVGLCLYDQSSFTPEVIAEVLRSHPQVVVDNQMAPNPFYEPPELFLSDQSGAERVAWKLAVLKQAAQAEHDGRELTRQQAAREAAEEAHGKLRGILDRINDGFVAVDSKWRYTYVNRRAEEVIGKPRDELLGRRIWDVFPDFVDSSIERGLRAAAVEQTCTQVEYFEPVSGTWVENRIFPSEDGLTIYFQDVTERKRAEDERARLLADEQAERARADVARGRLAFLIQVSATLFKSLDYPATLGKLASLVVAQFADWCWVEVLDDGAWLRRLAAACADPTRNHLARQLANAPPARVQLQYVPTPFRTGEPELSSHFPKWLLDVLASDEADVKFVDELEPRSSLLAPMVARGKFVGWITLLMAESGREFSTDDLQLSSMHRRCRGQCRHAFRQRLQDGLSPRRWESTALQTRSRYAGAYHEATAVRWPRHETIQMIPTIREGDCVRLPDGRVGRLRTWRETTCTVRVRRTTSKTHQFVEVSLAELERVDCPKGWMSPDGYNRYLAATLSKMRERIAARRRPEHARSIAERKR